MKIGNLNYNKFEVGGGDLGNDRMHPWDPRGLQASNPSKQAVWRPSWKRAQDKRGFAQLNCGSHDHVGGDLGGDREHPWDPRGLQASQASKQAVWRPSWKRAHDKRGSAPNAAHVVL